MRLHTTKVQSQFCALILCLICSITGCSTHSAKRLPSSPKSLSPNSTRAKDDASFERRVKASALFAAGLVQQYNGKTDEALESFFEAAMLDPSHEALVVDVASRLLLQKKEPARAAALLERSSEITTTSARVYELLALAHLNLGSSERAKQAYSDGIRRTPNYLGSYRGLASLHAHAKEWGPALKVLDQALSQSETNSAYWLELCDHLEAAAKASGQPIQQIRDRVQKALSKVAPENLPDPTLLHRYADRLKSIESWDAAERIYLKLMKQFPQSGAVRESLIDLYFRAGRKEDAIKQLESVARENPTNPQVQFNLGRIFLSERNHSRAKECFERALLLDADFIPAYLELARSFLSQGVGADALAILAKARGRERFKPTFFTEFYSALSYSQLKNYPNALKHLTEAEVIAKATDATLLNREFYFQLGSVQERNGDRETAIVTFKKVLEMAPDYADALNYLGYMWAEKGQNLQEARIMIEKAVKAEPDNAAFLDSLGWVHFHLKDYDKALDYLLKSIEKSEAPDPTLFDHLGDIYAALKNVEEAMKAWKKSLQIEPNKAIQEKLERLRPRPEADRR